MLMKIENNNPTWRSRTSLASMITYQDNKAIRKVRSSKVRSILHSQTINVVVFQLKFIGSMKIRLMSCFLIGTLPHIYQSKKDSWSPSTYWSQCWRRIWNGWHFGFKNLYSSNLISCSLAWVWCEWTHLEINKKLIKHREEDSRVSSMISKQAQVRFSWNLSLERVMMP